MYQISVKPIMIKLAATIKKDTMSFKGILSCITFNLPENQRRHDVV